MSGSRSSLGGGASKRRGFLNATESAEADMTPMMNILIILISFLVTMVVFTHLAVIKFSLPPGSSASAEEEGNSNATAKESGQDLTVIVAESGFQLIGNGPKSDPLPKTKGAYNFNGLAKLLATAKLAMPFNESVVLLIDSAVQYQDVISTMDVCRESRFPKVLLSGGLSNP